MDLFAGPGGWDQGLADAGFDGTVIGLEWDAAACDTAEAAGHLRVQADVSEYPPSAFAGFDGLIASPPCQAFSLAGKGAGRDTIDRLLEHVWACKDGWVDPPSDICTEDVRADLTLQPLRWADELRPEWIALEQVPPVLPLWRAMAAVFERWGYSTACTVLNAADFGVPQTRRRAVLVASRVGAARMPEPTHFDPRKGVSLFGDPWVSMADALGYDSPFTFGDRAQDNACIRTHDEPAPTVAFGHNAAKWCWQRPATTVVGSFRPDVIAAPGYRTEVSRQDAPDSIRCSVEEVGVLQSFPRDYPWQGSKTKKYEQVGNAVPPRLAAAVLAQFVGDREAVPA